MNDILTITIEIEFACTGDNSLNLANAMASLLSESTFSELTLEEKARAFAFF